jgi:uncharacterized protein YukE
MKKYPEGEPTFNPETEAKVPAEVPEDQVPEAAPEKEETERQLSPEEAQEFKGEMDEYTEGLRAAAAELEAELEGLKAMSPEWESFARAKEIQNELTELQEQIEGLADSSAAIEEAGDEAVIKIKE